MIITLGAILIELAVVLSLHNLFYGGRFRGAWSALALCLLGLGLIVLRVKYLGA